MAEPARPSVPNLLTQLENAYHRLMALHPAAQADAQRLMIVLDDFHWYAERLGAQRWEHAPRPGRWSFAENLWHIVEQAIAAAEHPADERLRYFVDHGKEHVGQAAELLAIFSYDEGRTL
jgi:hypothetical protein